MSVGGANTRAVASGPVGLVCSVAVLLLCWKICFKTPQKRILVDLSRYSWEFFRTLTPSTLGPPMSGLSVSLAFSCCAASDGIPH